MHVSCLAEQAKILVAEAEETNFSTGRFGRWHTCILCEQDYHGVVLCALSWACWKTYLGLPETKWTRQSAMQLLGNGLFNANRHEEELIVRHAELSTLRRLGVSGRHMLAMQGNLANTYQSLGRFEESLQLRRDVQSGFLKLVGEEDIRTLSAAKNYAASLRDLQRYAEAKSVLRKTMPVARRVLGQSHEITLRMGATYAMALSRDAGATLGDLREAVDTLEDSERIAQRVLGGAHPVAVMINNSLQESRAALRAREAPPN